MKDYGKMQIYSNASETQVITLWQLEVGNDAKLTGQFITNMRNTADYDCYAKFILVNIKRYNRLISENTQYG